MLREIGASQSISKEYLATINRPVHRHAGFFIVADIHEPVAEFVGFNTFVLARLNNTSSSHETVSRLFRSIFQFTARAIAIIQELTEVLGAGNANPHLVVKAENPEGFLFTIYVQFSIFLLQLVNVFLRPVLFRSFLQGGVNVVHPILDILHHHLFGFLLCRASLSLILYNLRPPHLQIVCHGTSR